MNAINTLAFAERLEQAGMDAKLSKAFAHAMQDVAMQDVATKADLEALKADLRHDGVLAVIGLGGFLATVIGLACTILGLILTN